MLTFFFLKPLRLSVLAVKYIFSYSIIVFIAQNDPYAQDLGNSPYSQFGIGDLTNTAFIRNIAMGNTGTSLAHPNFINNKNPALLTRNKLTIFEASLVGQNKKITTESLSQRDGSANVSYLAFAFPLHQKWTSSVGLKPFSNVNYSVSFVRPIFIDTSVATPDDDTVSYTYRGNGGITELYWTNGIEILKGLSIGINISYLFGSIINESVSQLIVDDVPYKMAFHTRTTLSDFIFKTGIAYRQKISGKTWFNIGTAYDFGSKINISKHNAKRDFTIQRQVEDNFGFDQIISTDTIMNDSLGNVKLPGRFQFGLGIDNPGHWSVAADFSTYNWSSFRDFNVSSQTLQNSYTISLGGELIPDIRSVNNYLKRITYRTGFSYSKTPIKLKNQQIENIGINFGVSLPVRKSKSHLNLAFIIGQRGTTSNGLIKERYFRIYAGISINDKWFVRRKVD
ncbi:MAG: hypothetical protein FVQ77_00680 [Cytophagales bacterium]|nr:hypothetical protein [Cytophagales bacterium]